MDNTRPAACRVPEIMQDPRMLPIRELTFRWGQDQ